MSLGLILILVGGILSATFSGTETGFYRVTRVRLVIDGLRGSRIARGLLWLTNHPALFVSTALIGNNIANYLVSLGFVLLSERLAPGVAASARDLLVTLISTPILFIYGELLPKQLFFLAPNRLLRWTGPFFLLVTILLSPLSALLYGISRFIQQLVGQMPLKVRPELARKELQQVLLEGQEAGLLTPQQRDVAQNLFAFGGQPIGQLCMPIRALKTVTHEAPYEEVRRMAERLGQALVPVLHARTERPVGYYRIAELYQLQQLPPLHPIPSYIQQTPQVSVLTDMVRQNCDLAKVLDEAGKWIGLVTRQRLVAQTIQHH
jgi:putative hemolysin